MASSLFSSPESFILGEAGHLGHLVERSTWRGNVGSYQQQAWAVDEPS